ARPQRCPGHAAETDPRRGNRLRSGGVAERQMERSAQAGDILIETLADLVDLEDPTRFGLGNVDRFDELRRPPVLPPVGNEETFQRNFAPFGTPAKTQRGSQSNERGRHVADRRRVCNIATNGAEISDLHRTEPPDQFVQARIKRCELRLGALVSDRRAEPQSIPIMRYSRKLLDPAEIDEGIETSMLLGD